MFNVMKSYLKNDDAVSASVEHMLLLAIAVVAVSAVGYMVYKGIAKGQEMMGNDFTQGG